MGELFKSLCKTVPIIIPYLRGYSGITQMRNFCFPKNSTKKIKLCSFLPYLFILITRSVTAYIVNRVLEIYLPHFDGLNFVDKNIKNWFRVKLNLETPNYFLKLIFLQ